MTLSKVDKNTACGVKKTGDIYIYSGFCSYYISRDKKLRDKYDTLKLICKKSLKELAQDYSAGEISDREFCFSKKSKETLSGLIIDEELEDSFYNEVISL